MKPLPTLLCLALAAPLQAALVYTGGVLTQDFTGYDGLSTPAGWDASGFSDGPGFSENRGLSTGGVTTGGTYAFDLGGGNIALGVQPGGSDFTPGSYTLEVFNGTAGTIGSWDLSFLALHYNDQDRGSSFGLEVSVDGLSFSPVAGASFVSPDAASGAPTWETGVDFSGTIVAPVNAGGSLFLRWSSDDASGSGSRDELALDNILVGASSVPEPSLALLGGLSLLSLLRRRR